ncbi:MAG TPA: septum formation initiator family protein [Mycobacteriales bacterium]|nr:septum formation initiator family protein [Mycobacteriales bacterium]
MPATPRRTPGSQSPGSRATARRPSGGRAGTRATTRTSSASRPAPQRRTGSGAAGRPARRRRGGLTGRAAVLGLVLSALVLTLAYPAQRYLAQQSEIARMEQAQAAQRERIAALVERRQKWNDPAYVKAQARERLQYVLPGEVAYVITDKSAAQTPAASDTPEVPRASRARVDGPWYGKLWSGVRAADNPAAVPASPAVLPAPGK